MPSLIAEAGLSGQSNGGGIPAFNRHAQEIAMASYAALAALAAPGR